MLQISSNIIRKPFPSRAQNINQIDKNQHDDVKVGKKKKKPLSARLANMMISFSSVSLKKNRNYDLSNASEFKLV